MPANSACNELVYNTLLPKFTGNIVLNSWFKHIKKPSGSPDLIAIFITSEILYKLKLQIKSRETYTFKICYKQIASKFGFTSLQVKHSFNRLEALGILSKSVKFNQVFITPDIYALNEISDGDFLTAQGNLIPNNLFKHILSLKGITGLLAIILIGETLYWNRPSKFKNNPYGKKANIDWRTNYSYLQEKFGFSAQSLRRALVELESLNLVQRKLEVFVSVGTKNKTLILQLNTKKLIEILNIEDGIVESSLQNQTPYIDKENTKNNIDLDLNLNNDKKDKETYKENDKKADKGNSKKKHLNPDLSYNLNRDFKTDKKRIYRKKTNLIDFLPITEEESEYIAEQSNRGFSCSAINKLANHLGSKYPNNLFMSRKSVVNYLIKAAEGEIREVNQLNKIDFRFRDKEEVLNEKILEKIENSKSPYLDTKIKKKIIARFEEKDAASIIEKSYFPDIEYIKTDEDYKIKIFDESLKLKINNLEDKIKDIVEDTLERDERNRINRIVFEYGSVFVSEKQGREEGKKKEQGREERGLREEESNVIEFKPVIPRERSIREFFPLSDQAVNEINKSTCSEFTSESVEELVLYSDKWFFKPKFVFSTEEQLVEYLIKEIKK